MKLKVLDTAGKETGKEVSLSKDIFGIEPNDHAIYLAVKHYMAVRRTGNHKTKERSEVVGSTKKIKRQKGTGTARAGDIKNPLFRGGGTVFGPRPRSYDFKLNKKVNTLAKKSALTHKAKDGNILLVDGFQMDEPKTKSFVELLSNLGLADSKATIVVNENNENVTLSARNLPKVNLVTVSDLETYDILNCDKLVISQDSVKVIEEKLEK